MKSTMTENEFREGLQDRACEAGSKAALARQLGVSPQYLGDVISGARPPGDAIANPLGYERVTTYRRIAK